MALHIPFVTLENNSFWCVADFFYRFLLNLILRFDGNLKHILFNHLKLGVKLSGQIRIHAITSSEKFNLFGNNGVLTVSGRKCSCTLGRKFFQARSSGIAIISDQNTLSTTCSGNCNNIVSMQCR